MGNNLDMELSGKYVVLSARGFKKGLTIIQRVFFCEDGFGCSPDTIGSAIFGNFVFDGDHCRVEGYNVFRLATGKEIIEASKMFEKRMENKEKVHCCICNGSIFDYGNNAQPIKEGRCCDACNETRVIPARLDYKKGV